MKYCELDICWKRIFSLEWASISEKSKAIAALIVSEEDGIISEGRNKIGEQAIPNPRVSHAEVEAIRNLNIKKYPHVKSYVLYAALEPCPMCMGTMVMGGIRNIIIGAHDAHGGAMHLIEQSNFLRNKNIKVTWMPQAYGDMQRGLQAIRELLYNTDKNRLEYMLADFSVYNAKGVKAARELVKKGVFSENGPGDYTIDFIFDELAKLLENN